MFGVSTNDLALERTKMANQRTYLAYVRTGLVIATIAGIFKKKWISILGLIMIFGSTAQYYLIDKGLDKKEILHEKVFDMMPILYIFLLLGAMYLQMYEK